MTTKTPTTKRSILGRKVTERLEQLGVSRRQFCMQNNISRQTLYAIEHQGKVNLLASTYAAIDNGCHWETGTAVRYALGDASAREWDGEVLTDRIDEYVTTIVESLTRLSVDELEREAIWLREELGGRATPTSTDIGNLIRHALWRLMSDKPPGDQSTSGNK